VTHSKFSENDIRPVHLNLDKEEAYARDVARLMRHKDSFFTVSCPACGRDDHRVKWQKLGLTYCECDSCRTVYVSPRPSPEALEDYYKNSEVYEYWAQYIFPASEDVRRERIFRPRLERVLELCERYEIPMDLLIEVGPGFGTFCHEALRSGRFNQVLAVEPTPPLAEACRSRGITVIEKGIEDVDFSQQTASVVAAFEVVEHLLNPRAFLQACRRGLRSGGLLILTCPNAHGFEVEVLGAAADTVDTEHLNYFNPHSLGLLVADSGFEVLDVTTPGYLDADIVRNKVLAGKFDVGQQRFLEIVLLERWEELGEPFQYFLRERRLSSHMWLVGRKQ